MRMPLFLPRAALIIPECVGGVVRHGQCRHGFGQPQIEQALEGGVRFGPVEGIALPFIGAWQSAGVG